MGRWCRGKYGINLVKNNGVKREEPRDVLSDPLEPWLRVQEYKYPSVSTHKMIEWEFVFPIFPTALS